MRLLKKVWLIALVIGGAVWGGLADAQSTYSAKAISGKVVDEDTGTPIAGVRITADWSMDVTPDSEYSKPLKTLETFSDQNGDYAFPAWGPIDLPLKGGFWRGIDPKIYYGKRAYYPQAASNPPSSDIVSRTPREFVHNGETIKMRKLGPEYYVKRTPPPPLDRSAYAPKAITGKLVDAETGEPLAGANIVAVWILGRTFFSDAKVLKILETVSDQDGNYAFPAWGPIALPLLGDFGQGYDPRVVYFKHGYWPQTVSNGVTEHPDLREPPLGGFKYNDKTIKLKKWDGERKELYFGSVSDASDVYSSGSNDNWKKHPRLSLTLIKEAESLAALGNRYGLSGAPSKTMEPEILKFIQESEKK